MFGTVLGVQISWLLPFALVAVAAGLAALGWRDRLDPQRAPLLLWAGWLAITFVTFSFAGGLFHPYYTTMMVPGLAAVVGIGSVLLSRKHADSPRWAWALPLAVAGTALWAIVLLGREHGAAPWLRPVIGVTSAVAVAALIGSRLRPNLRRDLAIMAAGTAAVAMLAAPASNALSTVTHVTNGSNPLAGTSTTTAAGSAGGQSGLPPALFGTGTSGAAPVGAQGGGNTLSPGLVAYLQARQGGARWLVAVSTSQTAAPLILQTGRPVIGMYGFSGSDHAMTVTKLKTLVTDGQLHYIVTGGSIFGNGNPDVNAWLTANCTAVKPSDYGGTPSTSTSSGSKTTATGSTLYRCG
jgi:4-amino-4-deoxy-L-arabinose transferase-like glycosyltransferase